MNESPRSTTRDPVEALNRVAVDASVPSYQLPTKLLSLLSRLPSIFPFFRPPHVHPPPTHLRGLRPRNVRRFEHALGSIDSGGGGGGGAMSAGYFEPLSSKVQACRINMDRRRVGNKKWGGGAKTASSRESVAGLEMNGEDVEGKWLRLLSQQHELDTLSSERRASHLFAFAAITTNTGAGGGGVAGGLDEIWVAGGWGGVEVPQAEINCEQNQKKQKKKDVRDEKWPRSGVRGNAGNKKNTEMNLLLECLSPAWTPPVDPRGGRGGRRRELFIFFADTRRQYAEILKGGGEGAVRSGAAVKRGTPRCALCMRKQVVPAAHQYILSN